MFSIFLLLLVTAVGTSEGKKHSDYIANPDGGFEFGRVVQDEPPPSVAVVVPAEAPKKTESNNPPTDGGEESVVVRTGAAGTGSASGTKVGKEINRRSDHGENAVNDRQSENTTTEAKATADAAPPSRLRRTSLKVFLPSEEQTAEQPANMTKKKKSTTKKKARRTRSTNFFDEIVMESFSITDGGGNGRALEQANWFSVSLSYSYSYHHKEKKKSHDSHYSHDQDDDDHHHSSSPDEHHESYHSQEDTHHSPDDDDQEQHHLENPYDHNDDDMDYAYEDEQRAKAGVDGYEVYNLGTDEDENSPPGPLTAGSTPLSPISLPPKEVFSEAFKEMASCAVLDNNGVAHPVHTPDGVLTTIFYQYEMVLPKWANISRAITVIEEASFDALTGGGGLLQCRRNNNHNNNNRRDLMEDSYKVLSIDDGTADRTNTGKSCQDYTNLYTTSSPGDTTEDNNERVCYVVDATVDVVYVGNPHYNGRCADMSVRRDTLVRLKDFFDNFDFTDIETIFLFEDPFQGGDPTDCHPPNPFDDNEHHQSEEETTTNTIHSVSSFESRDGDSTNTQVPTSSLLTLGFVGFAFVVVGAGVLKYRKTRGHGGEDDDFDDDDSWFAASRNCSLAGDPRGDMGGTIATSSSNPSFFGPPPPPPSDNASPTVMVKMYGTDDGSGVVQMSAPDYMPPHVPPAICFEMMPGAPPTASPGSAGRPSIKVLHPEDEDELYEEI